MSLHNNPEYLDVTGVDLVKLAVAAHALSEPKGFTLRDYSSPVDQVALRSLIVRSGSEDVAMNIDHLHGRVVHITVFRESGRLYMPTQWLDHDDAGMTNLLHAIGRQDLAEKIQLAAA